MFLGHPTGDKTLVEIATRLKNCLPPNSFLARLGGDEFAIIIWERHTKSLLM
ncbi:diguanylate cyclase domain-containing protein [Maritalea myrionectae]|uniref:diguanylate cyclase domain-containing protein n=1 Tax=Maritalea myrionectae TaxID=454601 RepID=UPI0013C3728A|nr:diguanylate cyclase [Maritalea myrionectae]